MGERSAPCGPFGVRASRSGNPTPAGALFLSRTIAVEGLSPEALAEEFVALVRLAAEIEREQGGADGTEGGGVSAAPDAAIEDLPHLNFGLGGFMRV